MSGGQSEAGSHGHPEFNQPLDDPGLVACYQCDLVQRLPALEPRQSARCIRCDHEIWRCREDSLNRSAALTATAAILYTLANTMPMLGLSVAGRHAATTVYGGSVQLWNDGERIVAGVVFLAAVVAPGLQIVLLTTILLLARRGSVPRWVSLLARYHPITRTWSMIEVMLLGVLVALVKIAELATVIPGVALFALAALVFVFAGIQSAFDSRQIWNRIVWMADGEGDDTTPGHPIAGARAAEVTQA